MTDVGQPQINMSSAAIINTAFVEVELTGGLLAEEALQVVRDWRR